jgi:putative chitinase
MVLAKYGIVTLPNLIDFVAECSEETGGMTRVVESGAYSAERAHEVWPSLFPTAQAAAPWVQSEEVLFNRVYGGRLGNRRGTNDGYAFRGRGMIQITGRNWYSEIGAETGLSLVENPDIVAFPAYILECAAAYWKIAGVSALANAGDFIAEVRRINGGTTNMAARLQWRAECEKVLTPDVVIVSGSATPAPAQPKETATMATAPSTPFSFANLIAMAEGAAAILPQAVQVGEAVITDVKILAASPGVVAIEAWINTNFTHVSTPGAAAVLEPKKTAEKA